MYNRIMYKNKDRQKQANRESAKRYRESMIEKNTKIVASAREGMIRGIPIHPEGMTESKGMTQGMTPDIIDKLTSPFWRPRLERLCTAFSGSPYAREVRVGVYGPSLDVVSELLDVTEDVTPAKSVTGVPEMAKVLPPWTINSIKAALHNRALKGLHDDSADRWQRAVSYYEWLLAGRPVYG